MERQPYATLLAFRQQIADWTARIFPDREIMLRTDARVWFFRISGRVQMAAVAGAAIFAAWATYASVSYVVHDGIIAAKDNEILNVRLSYRSLLNEVSDYQNKFTTLTKELEENHGLMLDLVEKNANLQRNLKSAETKLQSSDRQKRKVVAVREALKSRLNEIEREMKSLNAHNFKLTGTLNNTSTNLEQAINERDAAREQGERLQSIVDNLEGKLSELQHSEKDVLTRLTERTKENISTMEQNLARTGLNVEKLLKAEPVGQGGPFIAAPPDSEPGLRLKANLETLDDHLQRWDELQELISQLPLMAPLDFFSIASHFGKRRDPINKRWAMHYGLDLGSAYKSPVYATAPGVVTYAGRKGRYGKLVQIDHGRGLVTRYGHLHSILVKKGQRVEYRDKIGLLGNTGRSTGPHLHYEVMVNGTPKDPWKFIKAGRYVHLQRQ